MNTEERRNEIINLLKASDIISGSALSSVLNVSRQVVVQDIAILRAEGYDIISTSRGYMLEDEPHKGESSRVFKLFCDDGDVEEVDMGGRVSDVFIYHRVYGILHSDINIKSRLDIERYVNKIASGHSDYLKNITSGYHYHTVLADNIDNLDLIQRKLGDAGFLAPLQDYEPVDFWGEKE